MLPSSTITFMSFTQALLTPRRVLVARLTALLIASSKLCSEVEFSYVTRATHGASFLRLSLKTFYPPIGTANSLRPG